MAVPEGGAKTRSRRPAHRHASPPRIADLRALKDGGRPALEHLLEDVQALTYRFSIHVCGNLADAEDAMQEALLQTYRHAADIREPGAFRTWLYRTVKNACLMSRRPARKRPARLLAIDGPDAPELPAHEPSPEDRAAESLERRRFRLALQQLPKHYRLVIFLRDLEGLTTTEVAAVIGISEANVKQRLRRARLQLRELLA